MISVIICAHSRSRYIFNTLESLVKNDFPYDSYEIVVVDFNIADDKATELDRLVSAWPDVNLHRVEESRREISHARNLGMKEAGGLFLCSKEGRLPDGSVNTQCFWYPPSIRVTVSFR